MKRATVFLLIALATITTAYPVARIVTGPLRKQAAPTTITIPSGLVYFASSGSLNATALNDPSVDGVVIGARWYDIEQSEGVYTYNSVTTGSQTLASQLAQVEAADAASRAAGGRGKWARLTITTGGPNKSGGGQKPDWLFTKITADAYGADKFFTYYTDAAHTKQATLAVFWEPTLLAAHAAMIADVGTYIAAHPVVKVVLVAYANDTTNDWGLGSIDQADDGLGAGGPFNRWLAAMVGSGYATMDVALVAAGNATFAAYRSAFPTTLLSTPVGRLDDTTNQLNAGRTSGNHGNNILFDVVYTAQAAAPGLVMAQKQNLNAHVPFAPGTSSEWNDMYLLAVPKAAQMNWKATNDCTKPGDPLYLDKYAGLRMNGGSAAVCGDSTGLLKDAVTTGITYGISWAEVYESDILLLSNTDPTCPPPTGTGNCDPRDNSNAVLFSHNALYRSP